MDFFCVVFRLDEDESDGVGFYSVKDAYNHLKNRAEKEDKEVIDYQIKVIEIINE